MNQASMDLASFEQALQQAMAEAPRNQALARSFLDRSATTKRYLIGRNEQSIEVVGLLPVDGLIDDFAKDRSPWKDVPVVKLADVPGDAIVLNCSTSISPVLVADNLAKAGIERVVNFCDLVHAGDGKLAWPQFVQQMRADFAAHRQAWFALFQSMADEVSKQVLLDVLRYRLTAEPAYMQGYTVRFRDQYFEDFLALREEIFIDAGGFDGDTSEEFCKRYPDYRGIYLFEPSDKNMQAARKRLAGKPNIHFMPLGLSDAEGTLHFNPDAGSASSVSTSGSETIHVRTLDSTVEESVSFIKMDLEGWEMKALAGCRQHIVKDRPKLAISVYHAAEDFRAVPDFITGLMPDCRIYLRHYTQGWSETVMYFVPTRHVV